MEQATGTIPSQESPLTRDLFERTPIRTTAMFTFALGLICIGYYAVYFILYRAENISYGLLAIAILFTGLMYAHLTELQHELLHSHAFRSLKVNRILGFIAGIFTINSYSHYKYLHLIHHRHLGTYKNSEFFEYSESGLNSWPKLVIASFSLKRYSRIFTIIISLLNGGTLSDISNKDAANKSKEEYLLYFFLLLSAICVSVYLNNFFLLFAWAIPVLFVAEPAHFFIELPEHFGLNADSDPDIFQNTRTINTSVLFNWYTNGNNLHVAHHHAPGIPMRRCGTYQSSILNQQKHIEDSYWCFYSKVINGNIIQANELEELAC